ncbi:MAG: alpha/beta hydrolase [Pseudomonadota bacterium]
MSLRGTLIRAVLRLPEPWLVRLAGGAPIERRGRRLDPVFQVLNTALKRNPPYSALGPAKAREVSASGLAAVTGPPDQGVAWDEEHVSAGQPSRNIPVRVYRPSDQDPSAPIIVYAHFGGGVIGDLETSHAFCTRIARIVRCPVVSVDYRLAPEHRWPAGLDDCTTVYTWALGQGARLGAPSGQASIMGDSMGGNFAAVIAQDMDREGLPTPYLQVLVYPAVDATEQTASYAEFGDIAPLTTETMTWFFETYLPEGVDVSDPRISPAQEMVLEGLPPAIVVTAGFDPLLDEGDAYARRLDAAGVETEYLCFESLAHGFTAFTGVCKAADQACTDIADRVREAYDSLAVPR